MQEDKLNQIKSKLELKLRDIRIKYKDLKEKQSLTEQENQQLHTKQRQALKRLQEIKTKHEAMEKSLKEAQKKLSDPAELAAQYAERVKKERQ